MRTPSTRRARGSVAVLVAAALLLVGIPGSAAAEPVEPPPEYGSCRPQIMLLYSIRQQIDAHNARNRVFRLPQEAAALAAYNNEAAQQNSAQAAARQNVELCLDAIDALSGAGGKVEISVEIRTQVAERLRPVLDAARASLPTDWETARPPEGKRFEVPKGTPVRIVFEALAPVRPKFIKQPDARLQGQLRPKAGDPDPALPGRIILPKKEGIVPRVEALVEEDHIVSRAEIMHLPGFMKLNPENMMAIISAPINYQWLSKAANNAKSSYAVSDILSDVLDPKWLLQQKGLQDQVRAQLIDAIEKLLRSQGP